jgi:hypothetical protein
VSRLQDISLQMIEAGDLSEDSMKEALEGEWLGREGPGPREKLAGSCFQQGHSLWDVVPRSSGATGCAESWLPSRCPHHSTWKEAGVLH